MSNIPIITDYRIERDAWQQRAEAAEARVESLLAELKRERAGKQTAEARVAELEQLLTEIEPEIGWRSTRGSDPYIYYCEHCSQAHADCNLIPHLDLCLVSRVRQALASVSEVAKAKEAVVTTAMVVRQTDLAILEAEVDKSAEDHIKALYQEHTEALKDHDLACDHLANLRAEASAKAGLQAGEEG